jgi:hypothetical protein
MRIKRLRAAIHPLSHRFRTVDASLHPCRSPPFHPRRPDRHPRRRHGHDGAPTGPRRGRLSRSPVRRPPPRPEELHRRPDAHARGRDPQHPRRLPGGGRRHCRDQHVRGDERGPGRLRPPAPHPGDEPRRRVAGPGGGRRGHGQDARPAPLRGRVDRPDQQAALHFRQRGRPRPPRRDVRPDGGGLPRADRGPHRRRRGSPPGGDGLRHARPQGLPARDRAGVLRSRPHAAGDGLVHDLRRGPDALRPDGRGLLDEHFPHRPPVGGHQLRPRAREAPHPRGRPVADHAPARELLSECGPAQRPRRLRRDAGDDGLRAPGVRRGGAATPAWRCWRSAPRAASRSSASGPT